MVGGLGQLTARDCAFNLLEVIPWGRKRMRVRESVLTSHEQQKSIKFSLSLITVLNYAIRLDALPLQIVVAHDWLAVRQDAIVLAREGTSRSPNIGQVAFHLDAFVPRNVWPAISHDDLELEIANVFDREVFLADDLPDE